MNLEKRLKTIVYHLIITGYLPIRLVLAKEKDLYTNKS